MDVAALSSSSRMASRGSTVSLTRPTLQCDFFLPLLASFVASFPPDFVVLLLGAFFSGEEKVEIELFGKGHPKSFENLSLSYSAEMIL